MSGRPSQRAHQDAVPLRCDDRGVAAHDLAADIETADGGSTTGYAADFLAFHWFDKRPEKSLADNCADLIGAVGRAEELYLDAAGHGFRTPFALWRETLPEIEYWALANNFNRLGARACQTVGDCGAVSLTGLNDGVISVSQSRNDPSDIGGPCALHGSASSS